MRRIPDGVADMLDRPVDPQSINEYLRLVLIDRVQPSSDDLLEELTSVAKILTGSSRLTIRDVHNLVLKQAPAIEREEASRSTKAEPVKYHAAAFLLAANMLQHVDDARRAR